MWNNESKKEKSERSLKLERIDRLLSRINLSRIRPKGEDYISGQFNFTTIINDLKTLSLEVSSELSPEEKNKDKKFREEISKLLKETYQIKYQDSFQGRKRIGAFNESKWIKLDEKIFEYDMFLREVISNMFKGFSYSDEDTSGTVVEGGDESDNT